MEKKRIDYLINSCNVNHYHKTLLISIKNNSDNKNLSKADCDIFETISKKYK